MWIFSGTFRAAHDEDGTTFAWLCSPTEQSELHRFVSHAFRSDLRSAALDENWLIGLAHSKGWR